MTAKKENNRSWIDDITNLIRKKREENLALKKVQESLNSKRHLKDMAGNGEADENPIPLIPEEDQSNMT